MMIPSDREQAQAQRERLDATRHLISYVLRDHTATALAELKAFARIQTACDDNRTIPSFELDEARAKLARVLSLVGEGARLARVEALLAEWDRRHHTAAQVLYAPEVRASIAGASPNVEQARRMDDYLKNLDQLHAKVARAESSENALRSEIEVAFRKHGLAAGPQAIDALVAQRDAALAEAEDQRMQQVAHHASLTGTIEDLRSRLETSNARVTVVLGQRDSAIAERTPLVQVQETIKERDAAQAELQTAQHKHGIEVKRLGESFDAQLKELIKERDAAVARADASERKTVLEYVGNNCEVTNLHQQVARLEKELGIVKGERDEAVARNLDRNLDKS